MYKLDKFTRGYIRKIKFVQCEADVTEVISAEQSNMIARVISEGVISTGGQFISDKRCIGDLVNVIFMP